MMATLLLVDDDEAFRRVAARGLKRRGFEVVTMASTGAARDWLSEGRPDYALIDLKLGDDSGLALLPLLRDRQPQCRTVLLTGYASLRTAVEAVKLGAVDYLAKPASLDEVIQAFDRTTGNPAEPPPEQPMSVDRLEWEHIQRVLAEHEGNVSATARALNMHRRTLQRKLAKRPVKR